MMSSFKLFSVLLVALFSTTSLMAQSRGESAERQINRAKLNKHTVLMVVSNSDDMGKELSEVAHSVAKSQGDVDVVEVNMDLKANRSIVERYSISNLTDPTLLILSPDGLLMGGLREEEATSEAIIEAIPTPKENIILFATHIHKPVLAIFTNSEFKSNSEAIRLCEEVKADLKDRAEVVVIDVKDSNEKRLIEMMGINKRIKDSFIVVINSQGLTTAGFKRLPSKEELRAAADKIIHSEGCGCGAH